MINFNKNRNTVVLYPSGTCNLHCRYCGINKNSLLGKIDEALAESFKGDYYFNRIKEYFPRKDMLISVETWGGEPFLHMDRIYPLIHQLIEYYPYFTHMYSSTNFSYDTWLDQFMGLMNCFAQYPYKTFTYTLQLSVDGPPAINDAGRGAGVTARCLNNFNKLIELCKNNRFPSNVKLTITLKGTLDNDTTRSLLSKEAIIDYYKFYENNYIGPVRELEMPNITICCGIPNTAVPSPVTIEDGKIFAQFVKMCREIEEEHRTKPIFKYYDEITPFSNDICQDCLTYRYGYHNCGAGNNMVGFLPNNMLSTCHEGFVQLVEEYQAMAAKDPKLESTITFDKFLDEQTVSMCVDDEGFKKFEYKMSTFNNNDAAARLTMSTSLIIALAMAGEIEQYFVDEQNALKAAIFIQGHTSFCIKDNYNKTGSFYMQPVGLYKLLLNGAMQYIQHDGEMKIDVE